MELFVGRLRRVGNSLSVLVPKKALDEMHVGEGDEIEISLRPVRQERERRLSQVVGSLPGLTPFRRERKDRY
jgi:antitoxin component of MazEF toxin-antitoxin module